jgi:hypothetical protein
MYLARWVRNTFVPKHKKLKKKSPSRKEKRTAPNGAS